MVSLGYRSSLCHMSFPVVPISETFSERSQVEHVIDLELVKALTFIVVHSRLVRHRLMYLKRLDAVHDMELHLCFLPPRPTCDLKFLMATWRYVKVKFQPTRSPFLFLCTQMCERVIVKTGGCRSLCCWARPQTQNMHGCKETAHQVGFASMCTGWPHQDQGPLPKLQLRVEGALTCMSVVREQILLFGEEMTLAACQQCSLAAAFIGMFLVGKLIVPLRPNMNFTGCGGPRRCCRRMESTAMNGTNNSALLRLRFDPAA